MITKTNSVLDNFYNEMEENNYKNIKSEESFPFRRYCYDKDVEVLKHLNQVRKSEESILNLENFEIKHVFDEFNPTVVKNILNPSVYDVIKKYFYYGIDNGKYRLGDRQSNRYKAHNEIITRMLHYELLPLIEHIVGKELTPTYTYLSCYLRDTTLPPHTDRPDCEYSVSFVLDKPDYNWNIYVDMNKELVKSKGRYADYPIEERKEYCKKVDCDAGDIMMFSGIDHIHFREKLEADNYYIILLHYKGKHEKYL